MEDPLVTAKDMYDMLVHLVDEVREMKPLVAAQSDHETRIRALEKWRWGLPTTLFFSTASIITSVVFMIVTNKG